MTTSAGSRTGPVDANLYDSNLSLGTNEIRVLILNRGTSRSKPTCRLEKRTLQLGIEAISLPTRYAALSYVWGSSTSNLRAITCNGSDFIVTRNLFDFLVTIQTAPRGPKEFWIDAVCINQDDKFEKCQQIALMGEIYIRAFETIIWLGSPGLLTRLGFMALFSLSRDLRADLGDRWNTGGLATRRTNPILSVAKILARALSLVFLTDGRGNIWKHSVILPILRREYFNRIWTAQEFALSGNRVSILCGKNYIDISDFLLGAYESVVMISDTPTDSAIYNMFICRGLLARPYRKSGEPDPAWSFKRIAEKRGAVEPKPDLLTLLNLFRCNAATSAVDKVFGLTGLSKAISAEGAYGVDDPRFILECADGMDMNDSACVRSTFVSVARRILERQRTLRFLGSVHRRRDSGPNSANPLGLPSWVPDWSDRRKVPRPFCVTGEFCQLIDIAESISETPDKLVMHGVFLHSNIDGIIDHIEKVGVVCDSTSNSQRPSLSWAVRQLQAFAYMEQLYRLDVVTSWAKDFLPHPAALPWEFVLTATGGAAAVTDETRRPVREMLIEHQSRSLTSVSRQQWLRLLCFLATCIYIGWGESVEDIAKEIVGLVLMFPILFFSVAYISCQMWPTLGEPRELELAELRTMVRMRSGRLALAPESAAVGDVIALCSGGVVPLVLKPKSLPCGPEEFELVGEAYVYGMMDNSQWEYKRAKKICLV